MMREGFGLIEVLVALVLIGLVAGSALGTLSSGYSAAARARAELIMVELADLKITEYRSAAPAELRQYVDRISGSQPFPAPFDGFSWSVAVLREGSADLFHVRVTVRSGIHERTLHALMYSELPQPFVN